MTYGARVEFKPFATVNVFILFITPDVIMAEPSACLVSEVSRAARVVWGASGKTSCRSWGKDVEIWDDHFSFWLVHTFTAKEFSSRGCFERQAVGDKKMRGETMRQMWGWELKWRSSEESEKLEKNNKNEWEIFFFQFNETNTVKRWRQW